MAATIPAWPTARIVVRAADIDCEDRALRAVLVGNLREADR
jgi:hypothetical protein